MKARAYRYPYRTRRRGGLLWMLLGLFGLGALAAVLFARSRREDEEGRAAGPQRPRPDIPEEGFPEAAPPESVSMWVAGPAGNLFVRDGGDASSLRVPVVFLHSLAGNGGQWALQLDHLRRHRRAVALDFRGHGDSDPADNGNYTLEALASDVAAVVDQLGLRRFVLAGHSLGAAVAIDYASRHSERVAGLLLVDPNGDMTRVPREQLAPFLEALRRDPLDELGSYFRQILVGGDPDASRWVLEDLQLTHEEAIPAAIESSLAFDPLPALEGYAGPKLSVVSDMNSLPYSLHNLLPDLPTRLMPGTGHWLMMDRPGDFNHIVDEFLAEVEG